MLPVLKKAYESVKRRTRVPMWTYCGSMLLVLITASSFFVSQRHVFQTASMARSPEAGDIIKIRRDSGTYTLYKVMTTTPDSAYLLMSQYETNLVSGLMTIKEKALPLTCPPPWGFRERT
ncbi:hypothetical protein MKQ68_06335 [Chitinophaga horti]|uniref:Peptidase S26 domain-containing protein n=1 Tax=Chitinophaga horti TaxID=2920382 RepID=A0ABY6J510_9BACT|nr:hypothetical protein [Chitinophaga horti]UYQ94707.1 hypothetical protein MKQ68_06335 [Chitinophaga horti]